MFGLESDPSVSTNYSVLAESSPSTTGINEKQAIKLGISYKTKFVKDNNQTDYCGPQYPIYSKITYDPDTLVILGCEMIGKKGVVGRINTIAVAIYGKVTTQESGYMDFCYAPTFSRTWDMLNVIGNVSK